MIKYVIKRDGRKVNFNKDKIKQAISKVFLRVDKELSTYAEDKANNIADYIESLDQEEISVEEIQDLVEHGLMACKRKDIAKEYILYRDMRTKVRMRNTKLIKTIKEKLDAKNIVNQNANIDEASFGGRKGEADSELNKHMALDYIVSDLSKNNHLNNEVYIHDLDSYYVGSHNCLSIPFDQLLEKGFNTRQTDVRPAGSINTAFQLVAVIFQLQSLQQFGGCSATHLDWTMVPYVRKSFVKHWKDGYHYIARVDNELDWNHLKTLSIDDSCFSEKYPTVYKYAIDMTTRELNQAIEGMFHNLNTLQSRSGNQLPFTSINFGTCTLPEGRMVIKALLDGAIKGVGKLHKTPIFPCTIFQCMTGVNRKEGDPNYDLYKLALECTSKRLYPNYANVDWSGNAGYDRNDPRTYFSTMGKRKLSPSKIF